MAWSMGSCAGFVRPNNSAFPYGLMRTDASIGYLWGSGSVGCQAIHPNAQFAVLRDRDAIDYVFTQLNNQNCLRTWLGIKQYNSSGDTKDGWFWADGVPAVGNSTYQRYLLWETGEPNVGDGEERCGSLWLGGHGMSDDSCVNMFPLVCEVHGKICFPFNFTTHLGQDNTAQITALLVFISIR
jgi:hypothetical protein